MGQEGSERLLIVLVGVVVHPQQHTEEPIADSSGWTCSTRCRYDAVRLEGSRHQELERSVICVIQNLWRGALPQEYVKVDPHDVKSCVQEDKGQCELVDD